MAGKKQDQKFLGSDLQPVKASPKTGKQKPST